MSNFLSQNDERWKLKRINGTTSTLGSYGCLITCITWLLNKSGNPITPDELAKKSELFDGAYWNGWNKVGSVYPQLTYAWGVSCLNEPAPVDKIIRELDNGFYPIIMLDYAPKVNGLQTHYLVCMSHDGKGNIEVGDPIDGAVVWLDSRYGTLDEKYKILKVDVLHHTKLNVSDAPLWDRVKNYLTEENKFSEGDIREGMEAFKKRHETQKALDDLGATIINKDSEIALKNTQIAEITNELSSKEAQIKYEEDFREKLAKDLDAPSSSHGDIIASLLVALGNESRLDACMRENRRLNESIAERVKEETAKATFDIKVRNAELQKLLDSATRENAYLQKRIESIQNPKVSIINSVINKLKSYVKSAKS